jgi:dephospho-CoA kinase
MHYYGLTGGIGSGKSHVAELFAQRGIPIYMADAAARRLMQSDPALREALVAAFGAQTYVGGELNRPYLAERVFGQPAELARLNALVHPEVFRDGLAWLDQQRAHSETLIPERRPPFVLHESAIIFEHGYQARFEGVILVTAPDDARIARVMARDGVTAEAVRQRMAAQWPDERKLPLATAVIINDGRALEPQIDALISRLS